VQNGAAYMTITAQGGAGDRLIAAASPAANRAELHTHIMEGNVMRMRQVQGIDVKPGETAALKPGGFHVMLLGLKQPLVEGQSFPLTLTFEKGGRIDVEVKVQKDETSGEHAPASRPHGSH
jgi:copper(I)-binding protein